MLHPSKIPYTPRNTKLAWRLYFRTARSMALPGCRVRDGISDPVPWRVMMRIVAATGAVVAVAAGAGPERVVIGKLPEWAEIGKLPERAEPIDPKAPSIAENAQEGDEAPEGEGDMGEGENGRENRSSRDDEGEENAPAFVPVSAEQLAAMTREDLLDLAASHGIEVGTRIRTDHLARKLHDVLFTEQAQEGDEA